MRVNIVGKYFIVLCMLRTFRALGFIVKATKAPASYPILHQALFQKVNGDDSSTGKREAKTGWTHSTPDESSDFWEPGPETVKAQEESGLRTGWLHNQGTKTVEESSLQPNLSETETAKGAPTGPGLAQRRLQIAMRQQERNHRMVSPPSFHACGDGRPIVVTEHKVSVPLNRGDAKGPRVDVYFSVVEKIKSMEERQWFSKLGSRSASQRASDYVQHAGLETADSMILYLQGGPGFGAPTPVVGLGMAPTSSWAGAALDTYDRLVLMDQRGTGRSSPITKQTLERTFPDLFLLDAEDAEATDASSESLVHEAVTQAVNYLASFRADNIVKDAEDIREALLVPLSTDDVIRPWGASLGQSFGGFCTMTYLSQVEHPPKVCLLTGGIAPMLTPTYDVYSVLWDRVRERSLQYYEMYPGDVPLVKKIVRQLIKSPQTLPSGGTLTARRFLQIGLGLGGSPSSFASFHSLFNSAFVDAEDSEDLEFRRSFLKQIDVEQSFDDAPIYFWLHESIYANGPSSSPTNWAADRAYNNKVECSSEFDYTVTCQDESNESPTLFFGEMVFPWMYEDYKELSGVGLSRVAEELSAKRDWGPLFDGEKTSEALRTRCRAAAAVYYDDLYVDFNCSMQLLSRGGPMENCRAWISNEYQHSGLRDDGATIFKKLYGMATGTIRTPS